MDLWDTIKRNDTHIIRVPEERGEKCRKPLFKNNG